MRKDISGSHHHSRGKAQVPGTPIHFTFIQQNLPPGETVLITEGALKADTVVRLKPNARVIATSGVTCSHSELVKAARSYTALIAFDGDYRTNPTVCANECPKNFLRSDSFRAPQTPYQENGSDEITQTN